RGEVEMDGELFALMPKVLALPNDAAVDETLVTWIQSLGEFKAAATPRTFNDRVVWIQNEPNLSDELRTLLTNIYQAERPEKGYYFQEAEVKYKPGPIVFSNEINHSERTFTDNGLHLLTLFRFWNVMHYFSPFLPARGSDWASYWNEQLKSYIPKFIEVKGEVDFILLQNKLMATLHDAHLNVKNEDYFKKYSTYLGYRRLPVYVKVIDGDVVVERVNSKYLSRDGLKVGDVITKFGEEDADTRLARLIEIFGEITPGKYHARVYDSFIRTDFNSIKLEVVRQGKSLALHSTTIGPYDHYYDIGQKSFKMLTDKIGYLRPDRLEWYESAEILSKMEKADGYVVDLRFYPNHFFVPELMYMIGGDDGNLGYTMEPNTRNVGDFDKYDLRTDFTLPEVYLKNGFKREGYNFKGKVVVIVDGKTQSSAEFIAHELGHLPDVTIVGTNTIGVPGNVTVIPLPRNLRVPYTSITTYSSTGYLTAINGVKPDVRVDVTKEALAEGRDEMIEAAIRIVQESKK
ncbi:MAG: S41 family peptidase, partial [Bacilli bacterium]